MLVANGVGGAKYSLNAVGAVLAYLLDVPGHLFSARIAQNANITHYLFNSIAMYGNVW